ncbi:MAG: shikimate kinase [Bacteroidaceae bacterium]|nr:shikimate kinase [Candidatus Minthousia equi]MCQ2247322.1 shikimate kinase [Bacteroidaceae bacterium]MDO4955663.1 shikimate kinase [Bacteroidales bacterium]
MVRIILLGYMGAGKTTIGKALAKELGLKFYDLDWYIETRFCKKVSEIFATEGEEGFRKKERNMLHEVAEFENVVISLGGGAPCFFDNMEYINQQGDTVYLKGTPEVLYQHLLMGKGKRPLLEGKTKEELEAYIRTSLEGREPFYSQAKHIYNIQMMGEKDKVDEAVKEVIKLLKIRD